MYPYSERLLYLGMGMGTLRVRTGDYWGTVGGRCMRAEGYIRLHTALFIPGLVIRQG